MAPRYDLPGEADSGLADAGYYPEEHSIEFLKIWRAIRRRLWLILIIVLLTTLVVGVRMMSARSVYQASSMVEVSRRVPLLLRSGDAFLTGEDFDLFDMNSQLLIVQSKPLLESVVADLNLDKDPEFLQNGSSRSLREALSDIFVRRTSRRVEEAQPAQEKHGDSLSVRSAQSPAERAGLAPFIGIVQQGLSVSQVPNTRMMTISYSHTSPRLAAAVVNKLAGNYIRYSSQVKLEKFDDTSEWLNRSTRELRAKVEQAEQKLVDFTRRNNIISPEGTENLVTEKLTRLHAQVLQSETERILKESLYEEVKKGRVAQLPEAFNDAKSVELEKKLGELTTSEALLNARFGPKNPKVIEVREQIASLKEQMTAGRQMLEEKLKADYERAVRDERSIRQAFERARQEAAEQNQASIQFNLLKQEVSTAKTLYTDFLQRTNQADVAEKVKQNVNLRLIELADPPIFPVGPQRMRTIMTALMLSLCIGIALALALDAFDNSIKTSDDVTRYSQLPTLAVIPSLRHEARLLSQAFEPGAEKAAAGEPDDRASVRLELRQSLKRQLALRERRDVRAALEAYRVLRTSMMLSTAGGPPKLILVASAQPCEGKTTTTINTATALAQLGASVLIIDADMRRPSIHKTLGLKNTRGLCNYLSADIDLDELIVPTQTPGLSAMTSGPIPPNPPELISSGRMRNLLRVLSERYDYILIDSPPLMSVTDGVILSTLVEGTILVVQAGRARRQELRHSRQLITRVGGRIFGVVLNNVNLRREGAYSYQYYGYYNDVSEEETDRESGVA